MRRDISLFDRLAGVYDRLAPSADEHALSAAVGLADRPVRRILDVGGGTGRGVRTIDALERIVIDAAPRMTVEARRHGLQSVRGDATRLPVADESVDAVLVLDSLHHFPDLDTAIAEAARVLAPGGALVVSDIDPSTLRGRTVAAAEHAVGFNSTFQTPDELAERMAAVELQPSIFVRGFAYTVVGRRPTADRENQYVPVQTGTYE